jgi:hypothetical protein
MKNLAFILTLAATAHASGPIFTAILGGSYQSYISAVASDSQGNTFVAGMTSARVFPVTAGAYQASFSGTYDAFVAKLGSDGKIIWCTYLGGTYENRATGIALDSAGNVWVAGATNSADFPLVNPAESNNSLGEQTGFVAKFDPTGSKLLYSTYLGGQVSSIAAALVVDSAGSAYVAVNVTDAAGYPGAPNEPNEPGIFVTKLTSSGALAYSFFHFNGTASAIALDSANNVYVAGCSGDPALIFYPPQPQQAILFKVLADGSAKAWETALGSSGQTIASTLALNSAGEIWIGGYTSSADFPLLHPLESTLGARPLWTSTNFGATWAPLDNLPFALPQVTVVDPSTPATIYEATADMGVFKSIDGGATWTAASNGIAQAGVSVLAIDPSHPQTLYAATSATLYRSINGASSWTAIDTPGVLVTQLLVDGQNANNLYEVTVCPSGATGCLSGYSDTPNVRKSIDGGATWSYLTYPLGSTVTNLAIDPRVSGHLFAGTSGLPGCTLSVCDDPAVFQSSDGGATWTKAPSVYPNDLPLLVDPSTNPSTIYDGLIQKSADGGVTWTPLGPLPGATVAGAGSFAIDAGGNVYAYTVNGMFVSHDHAATWTAIGSPTAGKSVVSIAPAGSGGALYSTLLSASNQSATATAGFLSRISADGSTLEYSTYLRGHQSSATYSTIYREPLFFDTQNWVSGIALDSAGNVMVTGGTRAVDFTTDNPLQPANAGLADAFVASISADGSRWNYSTYLGGSQDDGGLAVGLDPQGNLIVAGQTFSLDFPVPGGAAEPAGGGDAFVVKLALPVTPAIASVLNGASFQPGIEAGSWVTIKGSNLANSTRTWQATDFVGATAPTALDGVSVTVDGMASAVEYISPTQINGSSLFQVGRGVRSSLPAMR